MVCAIDGYRFRLSSALAMMSEVSICLNCGTAEFVVPESELRLLSNHGARSSGMTQS
jgi:hypothetical protein